MLTPVSRMVPVWATLSGRVLQGPFPVCNHFLLPIKGAHKDHLAEPHSLPFQAGDYCPFQRAHDGIWSPSLEQMSKRRKKTREDSL